MNLGPDIIKAMNLIEASMEEGHLLSIEKYLEGKELNTALRQKIINGVTNNPYFESDTNVAFRLKAHVSASAAIESFLNEGESLIDCGVALSICYYLMILWQMEKIYGEFDGRKRFDHIFGEIDALTPISLRMVISSVPLDMDKSKWFEKKQIQVDPLSYIAIRNLLENNSQIEEVAKAGDSIIFMGDQNYYKLHPLGSEGAYNCIITSTSPLRVRTFGHGTQELSEQALYKRHKAAYIKPVLLASLDEKFKSSSEFKQLLNKPTSNDKIPGIVPIIISLNLAKIEFLLKEDVSKVKAVLLKNVKEIVENVSNNKPSIKIQHLKQESASTSNINEASKNTATKRIDNEIIPKLQSLDLNKAQSQSPTAKVNNNSFAGLSALKGAFNQQPAKAQKQASTAKGISNLDLDIIKAMNLIEESQQNGHLLGVDKYFEKNELNLENLQKANGVTTHPLFEFIGDPYIYRLKSKVSAAQAIESLLIQGETKIDCGVALNICYYLIILWQMKRIHGENEGRNRFDQIFGEKNIETPSVHRLILSASPLSLGTRMIIQNEAPVDPLSFITTLKNFHDKSEIEKNVDVGDIIVFEGSPHYRDVHPFGASGAYNCIITSTSPVKVRSFNQGTQELTERNLYQQHKKAYHKEPSKLSSILFEYNSELNQQYKKLSKTPLEDKDIKGFLTVIFKLNMTNLNFLLRENIEQIKARLIKNIEEVKTRKFSLENKLIHKMHALDLNAAPTSTKSKLNNNAFSQSAGLQAKTPKITQNTAQPKDISFAGLSGLQGAFNKQPTSVQKTTPQSPQIVLPQPSNEQDRRLGPDIIKAMSLIEDAQQNGHLLGIAKYLEKEEPTPTNLQKGMYGFTTHAQFERIDHLTYRLKPKISAWVAINSIMNEGLTIVDCGVALNICYYLILLWQMEKIHGESKGRQRFDRLFGEQERQTPNAIRLVISSRPLILGTCNMPNSSQTQVDPLSYIAIETLLDNKSQIEAIAKEGDFIIFGGDPNYNKIHPLGAAGAYNCIVSSTSPVKVRSFNQGKQELLEANLYQKHKAAYADTVSFASFAFLEQKFRTSDEYLNLVKTPTTDEKIEGFTNFIVRIDLAKLESLLTGDIEKAKAALLKNALDTYQNVSKNKSFTKVEHLKIESRISKSNLSTTQISSTNKANNNAFGFSAGFLNANTSSAQQGQKGLNPQIKKEEQTKRQSMQKK